MTSTGGGLQVVVGAGPLGLAVGRQLVSSGKRVRMVNRSGRADAAERVEVVAGDVGDPVATRSLFQGAAVVFHCASGPYARWPQTLPPLMAGIIEGAAGAGARVVYGDNMYMYGRPSGPLTEDLPFRPVGPNTRVRAQVATTLMNAHTSGKLRATIGRASDFYGPHARQSIVGDGVFDRALRGRPAQALGDPDALHTYTFIDDFARGLITLSEHEDALGRVWHVPSAETVTTRRFVQMVFDEVGTPARMRRVPKLAINVLALFNPMMRAVSEVLYQSEYPFVVDSSKFAQAFGSHPTPHQEAIADTVGWFRQHL